MGDLSLPLAWLFVLSGVAASVLLGYQMRGPKGIAGVVVAGVLSSLLGLSLSVGIAFAHTACVQRFHACTSQGDANLSIWAYSALAIPAYWLVMLAFPRAGNHAS